MLLFGTEIDWILGSCYVILNKSESDSVKEKLRQEGKKLEGASNTFALGTEIKKTRENKIAFDDSFLLLT